MMLKSDMFVLVPQGEGATALQPGTIHAPSDLPIDLKWWLVLGGLLASCRRRRTAT